MGLTQAKWDFHTDATAESHHDRACVGSNPNYALLHSASCHKSCALCAGARGVNQRSESCSLEIGVLSQTEQFLETPGAHAHNNNLATDETKSSAKRFDVSVSTKVVIAAAASVLHEVQPSPFRRQHQESRIALTRLELRRTFVC